MQPRQIFAAYDHRQAPPDDQAHFRFCPRCGERLQVQEVAGRERPRCAACGFIQFRNPAPAVSILIADDQRRILLGKRQRGNVGGELWALPGGFIEFDEDYLTAARREVKEETGLDVEPVELINLAFNFHHPGLHAMVAVLRAEVVGGTARAGDDLVDLMWLSPDGRCHRWPLRPMHILQNGSAGD